MTDERRFEELLQELERVGVDPHQFPAGITLSREEALRILRLLPDAAGPMAFLAAIREEQVLRSAQDDSASSSRTSSSPK